MPFDVFNYLQNAGKEILDVLNRNGFDAEELCLTAKCYDGREASVMVKVPWHGRPEERLGAKDEEKEEFYRKCQELERRPL